MSDLISRQDAIDALNGLCDRECEYSKEQRYVMCGACHLGSAFDVIEQLPSAEPKRGKWNIEISDDEYQATYRCSECGHQFRWVYNPHFPPVFNFCQKCGARMEQEHERLNR